MSFITWILLGLVAGFLSTKIIGRQRGRGTVVNILLGVAGALAGGSLFRMFGQSGITGFDFWSVLVATTGSVLLLMAYHTIRGSGWSHR